MAAPASAPAAASGAAVPKSPAAAQPAAPATAAPTAVAPSPAVPDALRPADLRVEASMRLDGVTLRVKWSPDGRFVAAGGMDRTVSLCEPASGVRTHLAGLSGWVCGLHFVPAGPATAGKRDPAAPGAGGSGDPLRRGGGSERLVAVDQHGNVRAWDLGRALPDLAWAASLPGMAWVRSSAVSPDGALVALACDDGLVRLLRTADGKPAGELKADPAAAAKTAVVSDLPKAGGEAPTEPDADGEERSGGAVAVAALGSRIGPLFSVAFHPEGRGLVAGDQFGGILHFELSRAGGPDGEVGGKLVRVLDGRRLHTRGDDFDFIADVGGVRCLAFDATGERLAAGGLADAKSNTFCPGEPTAMLFDWQSGKAVAAMKVADVKGAGKPDGPVAALRFLRSRPGGERGPGAARRDGPEDLLAASSESMQGTSVVMWTVAPIKAGNAFPAPEGAAAVTVRGGYDLDVHPTGTTLAMAGYLPRGAEGNGRRVKRREDYIAAGGMVTVLSLLPKPAAKPPAKPVTKAGKK